MRRRRERPGGRRLLVALAVAALGACDHRASPERGEAEGAALAMRLPGEPVAAAAPPASPPNRYACHRSAQDETLLGTDEIARLCGGALTSAPVTCYMAARERTTLLADEAIGLCACAASEAPVTCFARSHQRTTLEERELVAICSPIRTGFAPGCGLVF